MNKRSRALGVVSLLAVTTAWGCSGDHAPTAPDLQSAAAKAVLQVTRPATFTVPSGTSLTNDGRAAYSDTACNVIAYVNQQGTTWMNGNIQLDYSSQGGRKCGSAARTLAVTYAAPDAGSDKIASINVADTQAAYSTQKSWMNINLATSTVCSRIGFGSAIDGNNPAHFVTIVPDAAPNSWSVSYTGQATCVMANGTSRLIDVTVAFSMAVN
jgi:hypothetical protein